MKQLVLEFMIKVMPKAMQRLVPRVNLKQRPKHTRQSMRITMCLDGRKVKPKQISKPPEK